MRQIYKNDIHRDINGVIKVGQLSDKDVRQELEEYVLTRELRGYFSQFYDRYVSALTTPTESMGVWISGFFGSGKSHLLKILSYLMKDRQVDGRKSLEYFGTKVDDALLLGNMQRSGEISKDVILFNIDSKAESSSKSDKQAIVKVFMKVFDEHLGYFGASPEIADFERRLEDQGKYAAFQEAYGRITGKPWTEDREHWDFREDEITQCLMEVMGMSRESAQGFFDRFGESYGLSVEEFAKIIENYLDIKGPEHQVVFMVDEVGQYIGENPDLMLNLQTVVEDLGIHCQGRAWVMVTSQEDIDSITQDRISGRDFSKIQGRFNTRLSLSSANTDEVIKLRLLVKTAEADAELRALYGDKEQILKNQIRFSSDTADMPGYRNAEGFALSYPFVPYQFTLLQKVFTQIRLHGASGKHLAEGERSMLDAFQIAAKQLDGQPLGTLAPFHSFYQAIESFLDATVKQVITHAADNARLEPDDVDLLKTLFMIKYVKELKGTSDNLATLALENIDQDRVAVRQAIEASLARLERETLIQRNGDVFEFLTHEEQDIGREIKHFTINPGEVASELQKMVWEELFTRPKFRLDPRHDYAFNRLLDGHSYGSQKEDFTLHVVTPESDEYPDLTEDANALMRSGTGSLALARLPNDRDVFDELTLFVKTDRYIIRKTGAGISASVRSILQTRGDENRERRQRIVEKIDELIAGASMFVRGVKLERSGSTAKDTLTQALKALIEDTLTKLHYVQSGFNTDDDIEAVLRSDAHAQTLDQEHPNARAHTDMQDWLKEQQDHHQTMKLRSLRTRFGGVPYGWSDRDVFGILAELLVAGKADLQHAQGPVNLQEGGLVRKMMGKAGLDTYPVRVPETVDPDDIRVAREIARDALGLANVPSDAKQLFDRFQERLNTKLENVRQDLPQARQPGYPFREQLEAQEDLLKRLVSETGAAGFFRSLRERQDEFEKLSDESATIESFYNNQIQVFSDARTRLERLEPELRYVTDESLLEKITEVRGILHADDPTRDIPRLVDLIAPVERRIDKLRNERRGEVLESLEQAIAGVKKVALDSLSTSNLEPFLTPLKALQQEIARANTIDAVMASRVQVEAEQTAVENAVIEAINKDLDGGGPKPIATIRPADLASSGYLESETDIKAYLERLRERLIEALKAGHRLRIK